MNPTGMMQQYHDAKRACPDALLLFRMGDFFELFYDDAKTAAEVLKLALTSREKGEGAVPMAGFPHHQLEQYLAKLIAAGFRVAVCDQVEDARQAKGLVRREITRVVTRGTLTDDALLDPRECNYLAAVVPGAETGLAWVELSTGRFRAAQIGAEELIDEMARINPVECLLSEDAELNLDSFDGRMQITRRPPWAFATSAARETLNDHFQTSSLEGFGFSDGDAPAVRAAGAILDYLRETQKTSLAHIDRLIPYEPESTLQIDEATRRSLEIIRTLRHGRREGSLLAMLDRTASAMGSRLLSEWMANPLTDIAAINGRLDAVEELVADAPLSARLRESLSEIYDIERLLARVSTLRATPRDLRHLGHTLARLPQLKARLTARSSARLQDLESRIDLCADVRSAVEAALDDDCPLSARDGGFIRRGHSEELDRLRELSSGGKQWIAQYQASEAQRTGIANLKVSFNKVFGYTIEVTHSHRDKVPDNYTRRQTLKNAERYVTPELKQYEEKVLTADDRAKELEYELFVRLREAVAAQTSRLMSTAEALSEVDVLVSLADLARERNYTRPHLLDEPRLRIVDGRHAVLDVLEPEGTFVPNDTVASPDEGQILLITGPNMAGKSTYIRQVALIVLLAQMGSFVPAGEAEIGIADRIFARVGATDELSRGQSTFMVEMTETARILNTATPRSLVILDEIGRGTSTYDGVSLAWAVVEHIHDSIGCRTLFATHYHELTDLARSCDSVKNLNVSVREWQDDVVFLHKIVDGAADKSYGIHVARLAGVPKTVIERAKEILSQLEEEHLDSYGQPKLGQSNKRRAGGQMQLTFFAAADHPLLERLRELDIDSLTPLEALSRLKTWQDELGRRKPSQPR